MENKELLQANEPEEAKALTDDEVKDVSGGKTRIGFTAKCPKCGRTYFDSPADYHYHVNSCRKK